MTNHFMNSRETNLISSGGFTYQPIADWAKWPDGWNVLEVTGVATDSHDRVYVYNRGDHPVAVFDPDGALLFSWGSNLFVRPARNLGSDQMTLSYLTDDSDHTVRKFTPEGRLLLTLGNSRQPSDTGNTSIDYRTIRRVGPPFNFPTNLAVAPNGDLYISDGYGNARIHKYSPDGFRCFYRGAHLGRNQASFMSRMESHGRPERYRLRRRSGKQPTATILSQYGEFVAEWTDVAITPLRSGGRRYRSRLCC